MMFNQYVWNIYKDSPHGKDAINLFANPDLERWHERFLSDYYTEYDDFIYFVAALLHDCTSPDLPDELNLEQAKALFADIVERGLTLSFEDGDDIITNHSELLYDLPVISTWLYLNYPTLFIPYFFIRKFQTLTQITDTFAMQLPNVPLKRYKKQRLYYYWQINEMFIQFQEENGLSHAELCAFLYDFAPNYIQNLESNPLSISQLPKPTQVWMVGGNKRDGDFDKVDQCDTGINSFWQGNIDTKKGDIIIMYCLSPRSYIHSVWRATADGIADPFFHWFGSIYIGHGQKITPISLKQLKQDLYFSTHPLVRKNLQGVNGYSLSHMDYQRLLEMIADQDDDITVLPQLYAPDIALNHELVDEKAVETHLIEPFLTEIGYSENDWVRQLPVRMGRGERNFPDYAFLTHSERHFEQASLLIEAKHHIVNNQQLEEAFKQVWSYGQRLSAQVLVIADKDAIWIYQKSHSGKNLGHFDRTHYVKKFWKELQNPDDFNQIKSILISVCRPMDR